MFCCIHTHIFLFSFIMININNQKECFVFYSPEFAGSLIIRSNLVVFFVAVSMRMYHEFHMGLVYSGYRIGIGYSVFLLGYLVIGWFPLWM